MYTGPSAPRSIGGVLDDAFRLFRAGFLKTWPIAILAQMIVSVPLVILRLEVFGTSARTTKIDPALLLAHLPAVISGYLVVVIGSIIFQNAMLVQFVAQVSNSHMSIGRSIRVSLRFFPRALGILLVFFLGMAVIGIVVAILAGVLGGVARALLLVCLIVAVLIVAIRIFLASAVLIAEDCRAIKAIEGSWTLTRGNWWRVSGILTVLAVITIAIAFVVAFVAGLLAVAVPQSGMAGIVVTQLVSILGNSLLSPLLSACILAIYFDLKLRRDGSDLAGRVDALAAG